MPAWLRRGLTGLLRGLLVLFLFIAGIYFAISLALTVFLLTGRMQAGEPMYQEMTTPSLGALFVFQLILGALLMAAWWAHRRLRR
jgi:hypothetical protein